MIRQSISEKKKKRLPKRNVDKNKIKKEALWLEGFPLCLFFSLSFPLAKIGVLFVCFLATSFSFCGGFISSRTSQVLD